jgi:hypothetical protein
MSDTPRTKAATRMAFTSEHMVEIEEAQKLERELAKVKIDLDFRRVLFELQEYQFNKVRDELADSLIAIAMLGDKHERELANMTKQEREAAKAAINVLKRQLADMTKQRNTLAEALKSLCRAIISEEPRDITDLLKQSGAAIAATKGGSHE